MSGQPKKQTTVIDQFDRLYAPMPITDEQVERLADIGFDVDPDVVDFRSAQLAIMYYGRQRGEGASHSRAYWAVADHLISMLAPEHGRPKARQAIGSGQGR